MVEYRKDGIEKRKELLKMVSPMLRIFVDKYAKSDPEMWTAMVDKAYISKRGEVLDVVGEKKVRKDIGSFLWMGSTKGVFNPKSTDETRTGLTFSLACIGYEIGDKKDIDLFLNDIVDQLNNFDSFIPGEVSRDFVTRVLTRGVKWKQDVGKDTPRVFKDFIGKLNF